MSLPSAHSLSALRPVAHNIVSEACPIARSFSVCPTLLERGLLGELVRSGFMSGSCDPLPSRTPPHPGFNKKSER